MGIDGGVPDPLSVDDLDIGGNDLVASGDFAAIGPGMGSGADASTTSSSYSGYDAANHVLNLVWDTVFPSGIQGAAYIVINAVPSTDQVDVRLRNLTDGENILEQTGITSSGRTEVGPSNYTPTTTASPINVIIQFSNGDNSTSVSINDASIQFGVQL